MKLNLFFIFLLIHPFIFAKENEDTEKFIISYVEHESIINYYVPLLEAAYRSIGISPEFILINDKRALKLLDQGEIDADTAKSDEMFHIYQNIIKVPTPISKIEVMLICQERIVCDLTVLQHPNKMLGLIGGDEFYRNLLVDSKIRISEVSSFKVLVEMFKHKRVDYIFMVFDQRDENAKNSFSNKYLVETKIGYHILNKKHQSLLAKLDIAIQNIINTSN